jgi:outer membrane receptor protein involved in Fe transport
MEMELQLSYAWQALTLDARWRYIGGMKDADTAIEPEFRIPHYDYFDLGASYDFDEGALAGLQLRVGVENVTDEDPRSFRATASPTPIPRNTTCSAGATT